MEKREAPPPPPQPQRKPSWVKRNWKLVVGTVATYLLFLGISIWQEASHPNRGKTEQPARSDAPATAVAQPRSDAPAAADHVQAVTVRLNPKDGLKYVWIPPGSFQMGCSPGDTQCSSYEKSDEKPVHEVTINKGFWLGQTDVTQATWKKVMNTDPSHFKGDELPVESVDWFQGAKYCETIGGRLPTEAEWEYAARAGSTSARYGELDGVAWYTSNSEQKTRAAGGKRPNQFGLYDMLGNVNQWVADDKVPYKGEAQTDPLAKLDGAKYKVVRGGSWYYGLQDVRASLRYSNEPSNRFSDLGFRCVEELGQ